MVILRHLLLKLSVNSILDFECLLDLSLVLLLLVLDLSKCLVSDVVHLLSNSHVNLSHD